MPKVTRDDVARLAGTSTAVVSYVINDGPRPVARATREKVLAAIAELGYRPDRVAQAMARKRTDLIGMVVPDTRQPFFGALAHAVEQVVTERGRLLLIGNSDYADSREHHYVRAFLGMQVDGLILVSQNASTPELSSFEADGRTPMVMLHHQVAPGHGAAVVTDDRGGAALAVDHLLAHGHRRVHCFGAAHHLGPHDPVAGRVAGWAEAMARAGLDTRGQLTHAPFDRVRAHAVARRLLSEPDRPAAVFCVTDDQAIGLLRAATELGLRVPEDLAVIGFDGIQETAITCPPLTTVASDQRGMARAAVELVLDRKDAEPDGDVPQLRRFPVELAVRVSCGCGR